MAKSKEYINPVRPRDISDIISEEVATSSADFLPGTLCVKDDDGLLVKCDPQGDATHRVRAPFILWIDLSTRADADFVDKDGNDRKQATCLSQEFIGYVNEAELFSTTSNNIASTLNAATRGDLVLRSLEDPGKFMALTPTEIDDEVTATNFTQTELALMIVGQVEDAANSSGFVKVRFQL